MSFYFIKSNCHNFNGSYYVALSLYIDAVRQHVQLFTQNRKTYIQGCMHMGPLGILLLKKLHHIQISITYCEFYKFEQYLAINYMYIKKIQIKVKIVKVPSVVEVTTCISVADGLILLLYSIRHHERTLLLGYSKFYCLCRKNIIWRSPTPPLVEKSNNNIECSFAFPFLKMKNNNCKLHKSHFFLKEKVVVVSEITQVLSLCILMIYIKRTERICVQGIETKIHKTWSIKS